MTNCYNHVQKGLYMGTTACSIKVVNCCCFECSQHSFCCCSADDTATAHAEGAVLVNCLYCWTLGLFDIPVTAPIEECIETCLKFDASVQGPILLQGSMRVDLSQVCCGEDVMNSAWVVVRPWSIAVYESAAHVAPGRAILVLSTSQLFHVTKPIETPGAIEIRTTDFSRIRLEDTSEHDDEQESAPLVEKGVKVDLEIWRQVLTAAAERVETIHMWDRGVSAIDVHLPQVPPLQPPGSNSDGELRSTSD